MNPKVTIKEFLNTAVTLDKLPVGNGGVIMEVNGEKALRHRLLDMGLTPKTHVFVKKTAPMGDPLELTLRGYELTLRKEDASRITIAPDTDDRK
ncbi:MAG: ferrous iron transport protein A [Eubacteriales bacterium]